MRTEEVEKFLSPAEEERIVAAVKSAEARTSGEIRVHLENHTDEANLAHAQKIFTKMGMHKTELRNGVLFYLAIQDHQFSIIGDQGISARVPADFWDEIRDAMQAEFRQDRFAEGLILGIEKTGRALAEYFPRAADDQNELSDEISKSS